jgi:N-acetyl-anhydromuramyl-L-alanine amidase AmpD
MNFRSPLLWLAAALGLGALFTARSSSGAGRSALPIEFLPSENHGLERRDAQIRLVMLHITATAGETGSPGEARALALSLQPRIRPGRSYHYLIDDGGIVQMVTEAEEAWAAGATANGCAVHISICAASIEVDWHGARRASFDAAAELVADVCRRRGFPVSFVQANRLDSDRGITSHNQARIAWHQTDHGDPGGYDEAAFPWGDFLELVERYL